MPNHLSMPTYVRNQPSVVTTHLCCAPYVDSAFADTVIEELIEDEQRAVPPSHGFDLFPVLVHCLFARRLRLILYAVVTALIVLGLVLTPLATTSWLFLGAVVLLVGTHRGWLRRYRTRLILLAVAVWIVLPTVVGLFLLLRLSTQLVPTEWSPGTNDLNPGPRAVVGSLWAAVYLGLASFGALYCYRWFVYRRLVSPVTVPSVGSHRISHRLAAVAAAQWGNIVVQERDPFLGSGEVVHAWSFAIPLRPAYGTNDATDGAGEPTCSTPGGRVELDAVELNRRVKEAIERLGDPELPEGARVPGVSVAHHVVADGVRRSNDPLINPATRMPFTLASDEAIEAIMRSPQGGLRHYHRAVIPGEGKPIVAADGCLVLPAQDLGVGVTAYAHFAVEGGMLYAEFVGCTLAPIQKRYMIVDTLLRESVVVRALRDTLRSFAVDVLRSPWFLLRAGRRHLTIQFRMNKALTTRERFATYDYGARISVRELAAEPGIDKFLHKLDAGKYIKLLDRAVSDAAIEFLAEQKVDTSEFSGAVTFVRNQYTNIGQILGGQQNLGGANASFSQQNQGGGQRG